MNEISPKTVLLWKIEIKIVCMQQVTCESYPDNSIWSPRRHTHSSTLFANVNRSKWFSSAQRGVRACVCECVCVSAVH